MEIELQPDETKIVGAWQEHDGYVRGDANCKRIKQLVSSSLRKIGTDGGGWNTLYQDSNDERYWELIYPHSDWHGGGPRTLVNLSREEARLKYTNLFGGQDA